MPDPRDVRDVTRLAPADGLAATLPANVGRSAGMFAVAAMRGSLAALMLALAAACSVVNKEHCGNLEGNATCRERDANAPYCSICIADNNGCVAADPGASCLAETAAPTGADVGEASESPTGSTTAPATTGDPSTGLPDTTTSPTTTGDATTSSDATGTSTGETTDATGSDTSGSTGTGGPVCGNNEVEGEEVCDGTDLDGQTCKSLLPDKWGGGKLTCNDCSSYNDTQCCIGVGQPCSLVDPDGECCMGLTCKMDDLLMTRCLN